MMGNKYTIPKTQKKKTIIVIAKNVTIGVIPDHFEFMIDPF